MPGQQRIRRQHHSGRTRKGDPWLRGILGEVAASAGRSKTTYLGDRYRRLAARRGKKRALVAIGHTVLTAAWQMLSTDTDYVDLGADHYLRRTGNPARRKAQLLGQLQALGFRVSLEPVG